MFTHRLNYKPCMYSGHNNVHKENSKPIFGIPENGAND